MKRWIYKHGKRIFCVLTVFVIVISSVNVISAADDVVSDPNANKPTVPDDDQFTYSMYLPGGFGYECPQPIYDVICSFNIENAVTTGHRSYTPTADRIRKQGTYFSSVFSEYYCNDFEAFIDATVTGISVGDIPMHYKYIYNNYVEFNSGAVGYAYFNCGNFYYFPYYNYSSNIRPIFDLILLDELNANASILYSVTCQFSYIGNNRIHNCTYSATTRDGLIGFGYEDLLRHSDLGYNTSDPYIPVYIRNLRIGVDVVNSFDMEYELRVPVMSSDESNGVAIDKSYLFDYTLSNYELGVPLDLTWIINGVNGFFNAPFLGVGLTLGTICMVAISVSLGVIILKFLSHLK